MAILYPNGPPPPRPQARNYQQPALPEPHAGDLGAKQNWPEKLQAPVNQGIPHGDLGAKFTMSAMKDVVWTYGCRDLHAAIMQKVAGSCTTDKCRIDAVYMWLSKVMRYEEDPPDLELVKSPCRIFNEVKAMGQAAGDCDDMSVLLAASFNLMGMQTGFQAVSNELLMPGKHVPLDHVFCIVYDRENKQWVGVDPVAPGKDWKGHKQMIEIIGAPPVWYAVISAIKSIFSSVFSAFKPQEVRSA